jgi:Na+/H+ antiporter NhaC
MISDTTIAATSLGYCLKINSKSILFIAFPAAIITILLFFYLGLNSDITAVQN